MEVSFAGKIICRRLFIAMIHYRTVAILVLECIGSNYSFWGSYSGYVRFCKYWERFFCGISSVGWISKGSFLLWVHNPYKNNNPYAQIVFWCCVRCSIVWMFRRLWRETMPSWCFFFGLGEPPILGIRVTHREDWPLGKYISNVGKTMS